MNRKEKLLVLKTLKHGEADLIVQGLNLLGARVGFIAKGALKSRKRFAGGVLEPTHYIEATYRVNTKNDEDPLHTLLEAQLLREFSRLRSDYRRLETALHMTKLVYRFSQQGVVDSPELFNILGNGLAATENSGDLDKLRLHFEMKLLSEQGMLPYAEAFHDWLSAGLADHAGIQVTPESFRAVQHQIHDHLRAYVKIQN